MTGLWVNQQRETVFVHRGHVLCLERRRRRTASYCNRHDCLNKVPERSPPEMIRPCFYVGLRAEDAIKAATKYLLN